MAISMWIMLIKNILCVEDTLGRTYVTGSFSILYQHSLGRTWIGYSSTSYSLRSAFIMGCANSPSNLSICVERLFMIIRHILTFPVIIRCYYRKTSVGLISLFSSSLTPSSGRLTPMPSYIYFVLFPLTYLFYLSAICVLFNILFGTLDSANVVAICLCKHIQEKDNWKSSVSCPYLVDTVILLSQTLIHYVHHFGLQMFILYWDSLVCLALASPRQIYA